MNSSSGPKEFHRREEMTLQMHLTAEQHAFFQQWAASVPTLYFLDICVVGVTKLSETSLEKNLRKAGIAGKLKSLDKPQHAFSYLLALMEKVSDTRGTLADSELERQVLGDLASLRSFFKSARVVELDEFVVKFLKELRGTAIELQRPKYLRFLSALNDTFKLRDSVSPDLRFQKAEELLDFANFLRIDRQHPIFSLALACLYGNEAAKKLMKFKEDPEKFNAENVLADIMAITRFAQSKLPIEHFASNGGLYARSQFMTDDDGLTGVIDCFKPEMVKHEETADSASTSYSFTVKLKKLLTGIEEEEYDRLLSKLIEASSREDAQ